MKCFSFHKDNVKMWTLKVNEWFIIEKNYCNTAPRRDYLRKRPWMFSAIHISTSVCGF